MVCPDLLEWYDTQVTNGCISSAKWNAMVLYLKDKILNKDLAAPTATEDTKAITWDESGDAFGYTAIPSDLSDLSGDTDNVSEGSTNLFFTDERAQDAVGTILTDTTEIDFTYTEGTPSITADLKTTAVTAGDYTYSALTVDSKGRITAASSGAPPTEYSSGSGIDIDESYNINVSLAVTPGLAFDESGLIVDVDDTTIQIGASGLEVKDGGLGLAKLSATGTPSSSTYLRGDNAWETIAAGGDVTGDSSSTDNAIATFDGITGKAIQNTLVTIDDLGSVNVPTGQSYKINGTALAASDVSAIPTSSAPSGTIVGTTDDQTLTTKTIDADSNTISNIGSSEIKSEIITGLTELEETADATDVIMLYDTSGTALKKLQISNLPSSGTGDVVGPASAVDDRIATFDGITGKLIQDGGKTIAELADLNTGQTLTNKTIDGDDNTITNIGASEVKADLITGQTELEEAAASTDFVLLYDTSGTALKKVKISNLPSGGGGDITTDDAWVAVGDLIVGTGENTASILTLGDSGKYLKSDGSTVAYSNIAESDVTNLVTDLSNKAPLASPTFTGTPLAPTASVDTDTTQIATTAFVLGQASDDNPLANGSVSPGTSERYSRKDHVHPASGGTSTWTEITDFTATPASTSTITTTSDLTGSIAIRTPLRYAIGGTTYYGIVTAITSNLMTIAGAPLSSTITSLYYGDVARVKTDVIVVNGYYADASNTTLIESDLFMKGGFIWTNAKAYIVAIGYLHAANDSGATQPLLNFTIAGSDLLSSDASISTTLANSVVNINSTNYDVNFGEAIEIDVTKGTNGDSHDLSVYYVAVYP